MSDSEEIKIKNKRTGEVSVGKTARSVMQWKQEKPKARKNTDSQPKQLLEIGEEFQFDEEEKSHEGTKSAASESKPVKKKAAKVDINSLAEFIAYAYSRKGQALKALAPGEIKAIVKNPKLHDDQFKELLTLSTQDSLLAVPRQIIFAVHSIEGIPIVRQETHRFILEVLKQQPIYQQNNLLSVISNLDDSISPTEAVRVIAKLSQDTLASLTGLEKPKSKDAEALRSNAIYCLVVWLWESRGQRLNRVIRWIHEGFWEIVAPSDTNTTFVLQNITNLTEVAGAGVACNQFKAEADEQSRKATKLQNQIDLLSTELEKLHNNIQGLKGQLNERDETIGILTEELQAEKSAHANSRVHLGDDREYLRSSVVRRLKQETSLLSEGLQALRKDPPKFHIMDDHAERVLEGLYAVIRELEE